MDESLKVFSEECDDLLERMEHVLLEMEAEPDNASLIDELFRIVHTIKGSAGLFGFNHLVSFSHELENLAVLIRDGVMTVTQMICDVMLESRDLLLTLVDDALGRELKESLDVVEKKEAEIVQRLKDLGAKPAGGPAPDPDLVAGNAAVAGSMPETHSLRVSTFDILIDMAPEVFSFGLDPLATVLYLQDLGNVKTCEIDASKLPEFTAIDFEKCYLTYQIVLETEKSKAEVEDAFVFLKDSGTITIKSDDEQDSAPVPSVNTVTDTVAQLPVANTNPAVSAQPTAGANKKAKGKEEARDGAGGAQPAAESVRVDASKLENLINLVGELVIANANTHLLAKNGQTELLTDATEAMLGLVEDIRDTTLGLRMVQIGNVFNRFKRVVREVSHSLGKSIDLEITGGDTELDKTIVDKISDPLMHMIRNAIDHGIESPEDRVAAGKSERGLVKLNAYHDSGVIVIEITDNGKGLVKEKILERAVERGLISDKSVVPDNSVYDLIFYPGFSTAQQVTNLSGRGVGMDVVKRNIDALNGQIEVESKPGQYTKISIRLPLTLAIIDGFLFEVAGLHYVVPLDMVDECVEFDEGSHASYVDSQFINLRGEILPFMRLKDFFENHDMVGINPEDSARVGLDDVAKVVPVSDKMSPASMAESMAEETRARESVIVIRNGNTKSGIVVDKLLGEYQTVIKPVGKVFKNLEWLSGATILGNGDVAIIIDVLMLIKTVFSGTDRWMINEAS
jgi:two-component system chemotaxis sensor kinase CheA